MCLIILIHLFSCISNTSTMKNELEVLDKNLKEKRPKYYAQLQKPLTMEGILVLETKYGVQLPEDVKTLYLWKNGQNYNCYEALVNNSTFEPLENVLNNAVESKEMIGYDFLIENWWNDNWLPLFANGGGDSICYDMKGVFTGNAGQLLEFWHADNDRTVIAPDLTTFLRIQNEYYQEVDSANYDEFFNISDRLVDFKESFIINKPIDKKY